jgi:hypothetical protein
LILKFDTLIDEIHSVALEIAENKDKLDGKFNHVYSKELKPIQASEVSFQQFDMLPFKALRADHFVASMTVVSNVQFENVLKLSTERILSLLQDNAVHVDEVVHIQPISREVLRTLMEFIIEEVSVDSDSLHHVQVQDEIRFCAKNVNNNNYSGSIDEGVVDTVVSICVLPWEEKNPMKKVENSKPAIQDGNPFTL